MIGRGGGQSIQGLIQSRPYGLITPQMYGAIGDGITDDTPAIEAAIAAAALVNGEVYVPQGRYRVSHEIQLANNITIMGAGRGTVFVLDVGVGIWLHLEGVLATYKEGVRLFNFHFERNGGGSIRFTRSRRCQAAHISASGTGGSIVSIRYSDNIQVTDIQGWDLGLAGGAGILTFQCDFCQISDILAHGAQECVDLFETHHSTISNLVAVSCQDEVLDMGCCTHNVVSNIIAYNASGGVNCKVEDGGISGGCFNNQVQNVLVIGHTIFGIIITNGQATPTGAEICNNNIFDGVFIITTNVGAIGVAFEHSTTGLGNPVPTGNVLRNFKIFTNASKCINTTNQIDELIIENGYVEMSGTGTSPISLIGTSDTYILNKVTIRNVRCKAPGLGSGFYCFNISRIKQLRVLGCEVISTTGNGMQIQRVKDMTFRGNEVSDCSYMGIVFIQVDEANWRGTLNWAIENNRIRNVGIAQTFNYCLRLVNNSTTVGEAVHVVANRFFDTQGTKTSNGMQVNGGSGTWDFCTYLGNSYRNLVSSLTGTFPGAGGLGGAADNLNASTRA